MPIQSDQALVLRLTEFSETSQIVTLFGHRHGLLRLIAKGARRSTKTRFAAGLDLLELGDVSYAPPRGDAQLGTLTEWSQRDSFSGLRSEAVRLFGGLYAAELVATLTEVDDPHPELFDALLRLLRDLSGHATADSAPTPADALARFQNALLTSIGYAPDLQNCVDCKRPPTAGGVIYFSPAAGGLLCRDCELHHVEKRSISHELLRTAPGTGNGPAWVTLLDYHLTHIAGQRFKTMKQLEPALRRA